MELKSLNTMKKFNIGTNRGREKNQKYVFTEEAAPRYAHTQPSIRNQTSIYER
jgi:hypothetical protein